MRFYVSLLNDENERKNCNTIFTGLCKKSKAKAWVWKRKTFTNGFVRYLSKKIGNSLSKFIYL